MPKTTAKRRLPIKGQSPAEDRLLAMIAALASELAVTRERLDTLERLCQTAGVIGPNAVERFVPDNQQVLERDILRSQLIARVFRPLLAELEDQQDERGAQ